MRGRWGGVGEGEKGGWHGGMGHRAWGGGFKLFFCV